MRANVRSCRAQGDCRVGRCPRSGATWTKSAWTLPCMASFLLPVVTGESSSAERLQVAAAAHQARYRGLSRDHTASDLRVFLVWWPSGTWSRWPRSGRTWSCTCAGAMRSATSNRPRCPGGSRWCAGSTAPASSTGCLQQTPSSSPIDQLLGTQNPRPQQTRMRREREDEHQWHDDEGQPSADPRRLGGAHVGVPLAGPINCRSSRRLDPDELECVLIPRVSSRCDPASRDQGPPASSCPRTLAQAAPCRTLAAGPHRRTTVLIPQHRQTPSIRSAR
jgi:hypothetical protein